MNELDKWSAEACGISIRQGFEGFIWKENKYSATYWTLSDARCMEVFREKFLIETVVNQPEENIFTWKADSKTCHEGEGKTIKEAELACAQAIMEASK